MDDSLSAGPSGDNPPVIDPAATCVMEVTYKMISFANKDFDIKEEEGKRNERVIRCYETSG